MIRQDPTLRIQAPRWLDRPRGEAFWIAVDRLPDPDVPSWPAWLAPTGPETARSSARRTVPARHGSAPRPSDDPRSSSRYPASART